MAVLSPCRQTGSFDGTFQYLERVGQQTADLGSFDGTFQQGDNFGQQPDDLKQF